MNLNEIYLKKANAICEIEYEPFFDNPELDFVLISKDDLRYIIGVEDNNNGFIYKPYSYKPIIRYNDIHFRSKARREIYDECIECYILSCLCGDYELVFMDIYMHVCMWMFIDSFINDVDFMLKDGVRKYLEFCKETGITVKALEIYGQMLFPDLYDIFLEDTDENYKVNNYYNLLNEDNAHG